MTKPRVNHLTPTDRLLALTYIPACITYAGIGIALCALMATRDLARKATR